MKKLKECVLVILMIIESTLSFAQTQYVGDFLSFSISEERIRLTAINPADSSINALEYKGYLSVQEPLTVFNCKDGKKLYILQSEDIAIIYDDNSRILFWGAGKSKYRNTELFLIGDKDYTSSSELIENGKKYAAANLGIIDLDNPWCETETDEGKNVIIDLGICGSGLLLSNGYVSEKEYLYGYNNRVKQIELTDANDSSYHQIITLEDTAVPQYIKIDNRPGRHVLLKILDVYQGSKWNDTCINFILKIL